MNLPRRYTDNPYSLENGGPGNSFAPWIPPEERGDPSRQPPPITRQLDPAYQQQMPEVAPEDPQRAEGSGRVLGGAGEGGLPSITNTAPADDNTPPPTISAPEPAAALPAISPIDQRIGDLTAELDQRSQYKDKHWSKWDKIGAAVDGWARKGLMGAIDAVRDPHYFEDQRIAGDRARLLPQISTLTAIRDSGVKAEAVRQRPVIEREKLRAKVLADKTSFDRRMDLLKEREKFEGGQWKAYTRPSDGKVFKQYKDGRMEPVTGPNGDQEIDPNAQLYDWTDPFSGKTVRIKGATLANAGATIASGNAQRQQGADQFNASQQLEASKSNATNIINYNKQVMDRLQEMGKSNADAQAAFTASQGLYTQMEQSAAAMAAIDGQKDPDGYAKARKQFDDVQEKFYQQISKTTAGAQLVNQMSQQGVTRPPTVSFSPITSTQVTIPKVKVNENEFRGKLKANGVPESEWAAIIAKARTDGVIK
jgi:hypothetical protein